MTDAGKIRMMVTQALRVWENNSKLTFREVYSDQADIQVLFARCVLKGVWGWLNHKKKNRYVVS